MLTLKNKKEILEKLGQKSIEPQAGVKGDKIVACGAGLSDGFVADGEFVAPRLGVKPQVVATLDDNAASYTFDGEKLVISDISKSAATYTGAVEIDPAATTASTVKKFVGASFKEVVSGGLIQTETEIQKKVSTEREIYSVETLSGFSFAGFLSGDEDGFALSLEGAADWLAAAIKAGNANDKLIVKFGDTHTPAHTEQLNNPGSDDQNKNKGDINQAQTPFDFFAGKDYYENFDPPIFEETEEEETEEEETEEEVTPEEVDALVAVHIIQDMNNDAESLIESNRKRWYETLVFFIKYFKRLGITPEEAAKALGKMKLRKDGEVKAFNPKRIMAPALPVTFYRENDGTVKCRIG